MAENKTLSKEAAEAQIAVFMTYYGLSVKDIEIEDGPAAVQTLLNGLTRAIQAGNLEVKSSSEGFSVVQKLVYPVKELKSLEYHDKVVKAKIAMDDAGKKQQLRMMAFMGTLAGVGTAELMALRGEDVSTFDRVATIFSMV